MRFPAKISSAIIIAAISCATAATTAASGQNAGGSVIKSASVTVNVYAIVEDRRGKLIQNLGKDDFAVTDRTAPQKIDHFSQETEVPLSLGVAIDTSASQSRLLSTEQQAAKKFLESVLKAEDQAFVMSFDVDAKLLRDFTASSADLAHAIDSAQINTTGRSVLSDTSEKPTGGTHLYDAVYLASTELMKLRMGRKVIVLVTDGEDQGSKATLERTIESAEKADVIVYSIIVSDPQFYSLMGETYHGGASVRRISRDTGGNILRVKSADQIGGAFDQIARELRSQYRLSFAPSDLRHDGAFHSIQVTVVGRNCKVRTRAGYYDQSAAAATQQTTHP